MLFSFNKKVIFVLFFSFCLLISGLIVKQASAQGNSQFKFNEEFLNEPDYKETVDLLVEVFKTMQREYFQPVDPDDLKKFIYVFNTRMYPQFKYENKGPQYIKWRSAAYLVDMLKDQEDIFSKLFPPKDAERYEQTVLGKRIDLGIDGELVDKGYLVTWVEPRSDAYEKGLRKNDIVYQIDRAQVKSLTQDEVRKLLMPLENQKVLLRFIQSKTSRKKKIEVVSKEYFKQLSFLIPTEVEGVFCIRIERFNRMTGEDITGFMKDILAYPGETGLIIDLRGNPGGPPLAAREISAFFLAQGEEFAYFQRRNKPKASLDVPVIGEEFHYKGNMVILIDRDSGSASELFSGILQGRGRAELMGTNSAGQVLLKSMFYLSDGSMVLLVTARGHHPDGKVFSFSGLDPDIRVGEQDDLIRFAAEYLLEKRSNQ